MVALRGPHVLLQRSATQNVIWASSWTVHYQSTQRISTEMESKHLKILGIVLKSKCGILYFSKVLVHNGLRGELLSLETT